MYYGSKIAISMLSSVEVLQFTLYLVDRCTRKKDCIRHSREQEVGTLQNTFFFVFVTERVVFTIYYYCCADRVPHDTPHAPPGLVHCWAGSLSLRNCAPTHDPPGT